MLINFLHFRPVRLRRVYLVTAVLAVLICTSLYMDIGNFGFTSRLQEVTSSVASDVSKVEVFNEGIASNEVQRENATLFSLVRNTEMYGMMSSIAQLEKRFNRNFNYDWIFMNDVPFTKEFKGNISNAVSGRAIFVEIPGKYWDVPEEIDHNKMLVSMDGLGQENVLYGRKLSYRQMCRFNSGFFYRMPIMDHYRYYWRVEPYVKFYCDIPDDPFKIMRTEDYTYGFTLSLLEDRRTIRQLWTTSLEFFEMEHPEYVAKRNSLNFINLNADSHQYENRTYNLCHYWTNFEIADLDFFRSKRYQDYFNYLDHTGNFFYQRWGDAPVHTIALSYMLPFSKIHFFENTGYYHAPNLNCPDDETTYFKLNCQCHPVRSFTMKPASCYPRFIESVEHDAEVFTN